MPKTYTYLRGGTYYSSFFCHRIADKSKESKQLLQEEIDDREGFTTEAVQTVDWLTETKTEIQQLGPRMEAPEVVERIEKLKVDTPHFTRVCRLSICITQEDHVFRRSEFLFMLSSKTSGLIDLLI